MTDDALKRAYRLLTAGSPSNGRLTADGQAEAAGPIGTDTLAALANADYPEAKRDRYLAAVAESAQNADLLRALRALSTDASALSADVEALSGQPRGRSTAIPRPVLRSIRWYALAASIAVAGVVGLVMKATVSVESASADHASIVTATDAAIDQSSETGNANGGKIMMASFEGSSASANDDSNKPTIFVGDFDS